MVSSLTTVNSLTIVHSLTTVSYLTTVKSQKPYVFMQQSSRSVDLFDRSINPQRKRVSLQEEEAAIHRKFDPPRHGSLGSLLRQLQMKRYDSLLLRLDLLSKCVESFTRRRHVRH